MNKLVNYSVVFLFGMLIGMMVVIKSIPNKYTEVICESGTEYETGLQYELWSAKCNFDSVYGPEITVTMID